jgi:hypothetical protein
MCATRRTYCRCNHRASVSVAANDDRLTLRLLVQLPAEEYLIAIARNLFMILFNKMCPTALNAYGRCRWARAAGAIERRQALLDVSGGLINVDWSPATKHREPLSERMAPLDVKQARRDARGMHDVPSYMAPPGHRART